MTRVIGILALLLACSATSFAQGVQTGTIRGTVKDQQGLALPGATITATSTALQGERTVVTDTDGNFLFRAIPPGTYSLKVEMSGMSPAQKTADVPLGGVAQLDITLAISQVQESVTVAAVTPSILTTPVVGVNLKHDQVETLASRRDLEGIANLSPAVTESTAPNAQQLNINGAFAYDNLFMINGIDVNDNLFGSPQNVFIEDAIQETQVLTSGISAEYGRFSGGVVNAITKSGGNKFSGSFRVNLSDPTWSAITPFEKDHDTTRTSVLNKTYEATAGGPILPDKVWFFTRRPLRESDDVELLSGDGHQVRHAQRQQARRGEDHGDADRESDVPGELHDQSDDRDRAGDWRLRNRPGDARHAEHAQQCVRRELAGCARLEGLRRGGVLAAALLVSRMPAAPARSQDDSPIFTLTQNGGGCEYNAPYFDATDPEDRNNRQLTANLSYSLTKAGRHDFKGGWEWYRSQRTGGNSQSATSYVFAADFVDRRRRQPGVRREQPHHPDVRARRHAGAALDCDARRRAEHRQQLVLPAGSLGRHPHAVVRSGRAIREGEEQLHRRHHRRRHQYRGPAPRGGLRPEG